MSLFCSTNRAENGTRTRDPNLGKVVLYQLSYFRLYSLFRGASLLIAGAKVMLFSETPKLFLFFFLKNISFTTFITYLHRIHTINPYGLGNLHSQNVAVFPGFRLF